MARRGGVPDGGPLFTVEDFEAECRAHHLGLHCHRWDDLIDPLRAQLAASEASRTQERVAMLTCCLCGWATSVRVVEGAVGWPQVQEWLALHRRTHHGDGA